MSCSYDIVCVDCSASEKKGISAGLYDSNRSQSGMVGILRYREALEKAGPMFADPFVRWFTHEGGPGQDRLGTVVRFFGEHVGHTLKLVDEYGMFHLEGACNENFWQPTPGACDLEEGHKGPHHLVPPFHPWRDV